MNRLIVRLLFKQNAHSLKFWSPRHLNNVLPVSTSRPYANTERDHCDKISKVSKQVDHDPKKAVFTIPNLLTMSRIASIPFINYFVLTGQHEYACGLFVLAAVTDFLDGYVARNFKNQSSYLGGIIDPLADKLLIGSLTITLGYKDMIPLALVALILARDLALIVASLFVRYKLLDKPVTFAKFVDVNKYATVKVEADQISKINTFFQLLLISATLPSVLFSYEHSTYLTLLQLITASTTVLSSISYLYKRGNYKLISKNKSN